MTKRDKDRAIRDRIDEMRLMLKVLIEIEATDYPYLQSRLAVAKSSLDDAMDRECYQSRSKMLKSREKAKKKFGFSPGK